MATTRAMEAQSLRMSVEDFKHHYDANESVTVLDARADDAWKSSELKIVGAIRVNPKHVVRDASWPKDRLTVAYCT